jgi:hypothetical protein
MVKGANCGQRGYPSIVAAAGFLCQRLKQHDFVTEARDTEKVSQKANQKGHKEHEGLSVSFPLCTFVSSAVSVLPFLCVSVSPCLRASVVNLLCPAKTAHTVKDNLPC